MSTNKESSPSKYGEVPIISPRSRKKDYQNQRYLLWYGDVVKFLDRLEHKPIFDLVVTSPPYNIGKEYEEPQKLHEYLKWQEKIIKRIVPYVKESGSVCWQVGNYVDNGAIWPLDIELAPIFRDVGLQLRNRIIWSYGHGFHAKRRFSGRYEVVLWFTKSDQYKFALDPIRVPAKYPGKKYYKGPKIGQYSCHPLGKNPEDVWDIPNVKSHHIEKTIHPCQFPVGLIERLILSMTEEDDIVFDPFAGVASAGVAAAIHKRRFWGCETSREYLQVGRERMLDAIAGNARYRPHDKPVQDPSVSTQGKKPISWNNTK